MGVFPSCGGGAVLDEPGTCAGDSKELALWSGSVATSNRANSLPVMPTAS